MRSGKSLTIAGAARAIIHDAGQGDTFTRHEPARNTGEKWPIAALRSTWRHVTQSANQLCLTSRPCFWDAFRFLRYSPSLTRGLHNKSGEILKGIYEDSLAHFSSLFLSWRVSKISWGFLRILIDSSPVRIYLKKYLNPATPLGFFWILLTVDEFFDSLMFFFSFPLQTFQNLEDSW